MYRMTLVEIDLNMNITPFDIDNEDRQEGEAQMHLPDLNVDIDFVPDLNFTSTSPMVEISSSNHVVLDLNEPCLQDDTNMEIELHQETNLNIGMTCS